MSGSAQQGSLDDMAAQMAEQMMTSSGNLVKGGGSLPQGRGGSGGAEGGFTPQAGGQVIDANAAKGGITGPADLNKMMGDQDMDKGSYTGAQITSEPGRQGGAPESCANSTNEPGRQDGGGAGEPAQGQTQSADASARSRKAGKVGGEGAAPPAQNVSEDEDESTRKRKSAMAKAADCDEDEDDEDEAEKGGQQYDADELIKSLEVLEAVAQGSSVPAPAERRSELASKLSDGTLSKSEMQELSDLMKSGEVHAKGDTLAKSDTEASTPETHQQKFSDDYELSEGYEVSPFLERHSQMTAAALDQVQTSLSKSIDQNRDGQVAFNSQLAKSLMGMAQLAKIQDSLIKSQASQLGELTARLSHVENQPVPRRGVTSAAQLLHKSMGAGEVGVPQDQLGKSDVMDSLEQMAMRNITATQSGHRVDMAMALIEQGGQIAKSLYNDILAFRQSDTGTVNVR